MADVEKCASERKVLGIMEEMNKGGKWRVVNMGQKAVGGKAACFLRAVGCVRKSGLFSVSGTQGEDGKENR